MTHTYQKPETDARYVRSGKVVTLCGSTRFREQYEAVTYQLALEGVLVFSCGKLTPCHSDGLADDDKSKLDRLHIHKIDMSDAVYIINPGGYIGESTQRELAHAYHTGKTVYSMEPITNFDFIKQRG